MHATALPHWPSDPQTATPFPEHFVAPGTHMPAQAPLTHAYWHALGAPHAPVEVQVATALSEPPSAPVAHSVWLGAHTPWHEDVVPLVTHVLLPQSTGAGKWPLESQVCSALPEHCVAPGVQAPAQTPPEQAPIAHCTPVPQVPLAVQVSTPSVPHCLVPGVHTPWHDATPPVRTHAWAVQVVEVTHAPVALHVWTSCEPPVAHWVVLGAHIPEHPPFTQAWFPQSIAAPHWPLVPQIWTLLPVHLASPDVQTGPPSPASA